MEWWQYLLLVNLYLVLFYGFYALLLRSETFFQLNRIYLVASALLSFFIPMIHADWVRNLFITQKVQYTLFVYSNPIMVYHFKSMDDHHITIGQLMLFVYATGAVILTTKFIWQLISLKKMIDQPISSGAFSFFKSIRLGPNIDNLDVIAAHEQAHAGQWHSADILLIEAIAIINWFNPVVYFYKLGVKHIHEFIADKQALKNGTSKAEYALLLLSQTLKTPAHQLVNPFFNHSLLKRRIIMLQKTHSQRAALLKYGLSAPLFILMLILSSATISKSRTVKLFNTKAEEVFLTPAHSLDSSGIDNAQLNEIALKENCSIKQPQAENKNAYIPEIEIDTVPVKNNGPVFTSVESPPEFPGGVAGLYQFLRQNLKYPDAMRKNNIQGKVFMSFIVEKDGSLSGVHALRDIGYGSAEESVRVLELSPKWKPGYQNGRAVKVQYTLPISFSLDKDKPGKDTLQKSGSVEVKKNKNGHGLTTTIIYTVPKDTINELTLTGSNSTPVYVMNGKEIANLNNVNPNDIESISILKPTPNDNSLVMQYGDKAVNGVVVIKTKSPEKKPDIKH
ncbi:MAG: hypothetical protein JWP37_2148 [Mucilaginibacter sp.]|nr:hypothetical protein [Mucilaginibacter sp.]